MKPLRQPLWSWNRNKLWKPQKAPKVVQKWLQPEWFHQKLNLILLLLYFKTIHTDPNSYTHAQLPHTACTSIFIRGCKVNLFNSCLHANIIGYHVEKTLPYIWVNGCINYIYFLKNKANKQTKMTYLMQASICFPIHQLSTAVQIANGSEYRQKWYYKHKSKYQCLWYNALSFIYIHMPSLL